MLVVHINKEECVWYIRREERVFPNNENIVDLIFKEIERNARKKRRRTKTHQHSDARSSHEEYRRVVASIVTHDGFNTKNQRIRFFCVVDLNKSLLLLSLLILDFLLVVGLFTATHKSLESKKNFPHFRSSLEQKRREEWRSRTMRTVDLARKKKND